MTVAQVANLSAEAISIEERSPLQIILMRFRRHRLAMVSLILMIFIFTITVFAPVIAPFEVQ
jgi:peptide/nickel transport system permease protein